MRAFYNENDAFPAAWLRNLSAAGHIAQGIVDERSVADIEPKDIEGHEQAHFFAGIGAWSYALRLAGWPDDTPVWTGSCPCQPFSAAGKGLAHADARHLWPAWFRLIGKCRPPVVFGEQVASKAGRSWMAAVRADLESLGYAVGAARLPAYGVGAFHARWRFFFVAAAPDAYQLRWERLRPQAAGTRSEQQLERLVQDQLQLSVPSGRFGALVDGTSGRVGKLRAYGNTIEPWLAAEFIGAAADVILSAALAQGRAEK